MPSARAPLLCIILSSVNPEVYGPRPETSGPVPLLVRAWLSRESAQLSSENLLKMQFPWLCCQRPSWVGWGMGGHGDGLFLPATTLLVLWPQDNSFSLLATFAKYLPAFLFFENKNKNHVLKGGLAYYCWTWDLRNQGKAHHPAWWEKKYGILAKMKVDYTPS